MRYVPATPCRFAVEAPPFGTKPRAGSAKSAESPRTSQPLARSELRKSPAQQNRRAFVQRQVFQIELRLGVESGMVQ